MNKTNKTILFLVTLSLLSWICSSNLAKAGIEAVPEPAALVVDYLGFENGINRAGSVCNLLAHIVNRKPADGRLTGFSLNLSSGVKIVSAPQDCSVINVEAGKSVDLTWKVTAEQPGSYKVTLSWTDDKAAPANCSTTLQFTKLLGLAPADYVPTPRPIDTDIDVCAYYFPGWCEGSHKWSDIKEIAPIRKPVLGYYDEGNPEVIDWQIKWASENGIKCFLVDWYWRMGKEQLRHWFDGYRKARYRSQLKVAIMWANHNSNRKNNHSLQDWLDVTKEWVDNYFSLDSYYKIDGKPAVFIWFTKAISDELGGVEEAKKALELSQQMAKKAGFAGITFVDMGWIFSPDRIAELRYEGYRYITTYQGWNEVAHDRRAAIYADVVRLSPSEWNKKQKTVGDVLNFLPVTDTGFDNRPWKKKEPKVEVITNRTPELFEQSMRDIKSFCKENNKPMVIIGPVNEWGDGCYIEPCTEYGFGMFEAIRKVFGKGDPNSWPVNVAPCDVGRGPYDYPKYKKD